jgi:hypothetical protein
MKAAKTAPTQPPPRGRIHELRTFNIFFICFCFLFLEFYDSGAVGLDVEFSLVEVGIRKGKSTKKVEKLKG